MITDRRALRIIIGAIMEGWNIENKLLADNLTDAFIAFETKTRQNVPTEKAKKDIIEFYLTGLPGIRAKDSLLNRIYKAMRLHPDTWPEDLINFISRKDEQGQTIEQYAAWCERDKYNSPKAHQIAQNPNIIRVTWPQAFTVPASVHTLPTIQQENVKFTPSPRRMANHE
jgi:hypothetical protein